MADPEQQQQQQQQQPQQPYKTISFTDKDALHSVAECLKSDGVVVVENVFDGEECTAFCNEIANCLNRICPKLDSTPSGGRTWKQENLPPGPRSGLMQALVANLPPVWDIRTNKRVREVFTQAYSGLRGYEVNDFFSSMDGINVRPHAPPFHEEKEGVYNDWAHLDQTTREQPYWCIQGQVVLTNTTACFRCSPKSHQIYGDLLDIANNNSKSGWCKFNNSQVPKVKKRIEEIGGTWQVPVRTKRGSMILWLSSTVHSAMLQTKTRVNITNKEEKEKEEKWRDWRFVVYTCYRPKAECDNGHERRLKTCLKDNHCTNHSGQKIFPKQRVRINYDQNMQNIVNNPSQMFRMIPLLETKEIKQLTRFKS